MLFPSFPNEKLPHDYSAALNLICLPQKRLLEPGLCISFPKPQALENEFIANVRPTLSKRCSHSSSSASVNGRRSAN